MYKKALILCLMLVCIFSFNGCSKAETTSENGNEITIIYNDELMNRSILAFVKTEAREYTQKTGVEIVFEPISGLTMDEFNLKLDSKFTKQNGPSLLLATPNNTSYWRDKSFSDVTTLENYDSIIDPLKSNTFIPFTYYIASTNINAKILEKYRFTAEEMNCDNYIALAKLYRDDNPVELDPIYYGDLLRHYFDIDFIDENNNVELINDKIIKSIEALKEDLHSDRYIYPEFQSKDEIDEYLSKNAYLNAYQNRRVAPEKYILAPFGNRTYNSLNLRVAFDYTSDPTFITIPSYRKQTRFRYYGFIVNQNGKNIDAAKLFVNDFLSKETQMDIYTTGGGAEIDFAPVINGLDTEKKDYNEQNSVDKNLIKITEKTYDKLENGDYLIFYNYNVPHTKEIFFDVVTEYIFTDKYTDIDEVVKVLKANQDKVNLLK